MSPSQETISSNRINQGAINSLIHVTIIIHGIDEGNEVDHDSIYLKKLFNIIEMTHTSPTMTHRLGMKKPSGPRPMKLTMESKEEKDNIMSQLGK